MTDQPSQRPESERPGGNPPSGFEPPRFAPPYGAEPPTQQQYGQGGHGQGGYGQSHYGDSGQYGAPYGQPSAAYNQGPYSQPSSYGQAAGPYGQPGYYGGPAEPKTLSIASMVCGIASVIMGFLLLPQVAAIVTGHMALKREPSGKGMSITGLVLGYLCLLGYGAFWLLLIIGLAVASTTSTNTF
ncbi:DUF4190 domain-containing protein [Pseudarthrobacter sp. R1]|uniref:DUF4190 domain-containing protein n=1 Tax=Pseudarthrobacter sp. R1 TaxID=2944934 RepID=UPI002109DD17|nr:DUF4190 domain-containing protein [Pseudarthrobacter sp. R1]MCQ6272379.1 DUF4190 domain-containing protein [Pseudarthrobacter sp. R1]